VHRGWAVMSKSHSQGKLKGTSASHPNALLFPIGAVRQEFFYTGIEKESYFEMVCSEPITGVWRKLSSPMCQEQG